MLYSVFPLLSQPKLVLMWLFVLLDSNSMFCMLQNLELLLWDFYPGANCILFIVHSSCFVSSLRIVSVFFCFNLSFESFYIISDIIFSFFCRGGAVSSSSLVGSPGSGFLSGASLYATIEKYIHLLELLELVDQNFFALPRTNPLSDSGITCLEDSLFEGNLVDIRDSEYILSSSPSDLSSVSIAYCCVPSSIEFPVFVFS